MAYYVNKTDGTAILVLDGTKDTTSTSLTLIGRLSQVFGEAQNENFVHLLENFALATAPPFPIKGQLWYDTTLNNIKSYTGNTWVAVGSDIKGNISLTGNLFIGSNGFKISDLGNVTLTNSVNSADISFYSNISGTNTRTLYINGVSGLVEVAGNATSNYGVTTKIYVDSKVDTLTSNVNANNVSYAANFSAINANLVVRTNTDSDFLNSITAANAQIDLRETISRVNSTTVALSSAISANLNTALGTITAANAAMVTANLNMKSYVDTINSTTLANAQSQQSQIDSKAAINSPTFTGTPSAPTPAGGDDSTKLATTAFVSDAVSAAVSGISVLPAGIISMWSGSVATIPTGWVLCNGSNSTPDLRDKFIIGAGNTYDVAATGGSKNSTLIAHTHTVTDSGHSHDGVLQAADAAGGRRVTLNRAVGQNENDATGGNFGTSTDSASTGISINSTGSDNGVNSNLPPYYALCFIMKT
jgi:hypothetical protein